MNKVHFNDNVQIIYYEIAHKTKIQKIKSYLKKIVKIVQI